MLETNITTWDELQRKHPDINVNSVNEAIRQSPHPINKRALKSLFNATSETQPKTTRFIPQIFHAFLPSTKRFTKPDTSPVCAEISSSCLKFM